MTRPHYLCLVSLLPDFIEIGKVSWLDLESSALYGGKKNRCFMDFAHDPEEELSYWWRYAVIVVMLIGFTILGFITSLSYENAPPIPGKVVDEAGKTLFAKENIQEGQSAFLRYNLMEHGTLWGHGAYLGPDYTAEYLHQEGLALLDHLATKKSGKVFSALTQEEQLGIKDSVPFILKQNRYDEREDSLLYTPGEVEAYKKALAYWKNYFTEGEAPGLPKNYIQNAEDLTNLTAFFSWASWAAVANRPGETCSYTNNFPYDPLIGNFPCADAYFWSAMSLIFLLGATGLMLFLFGRFDFLGWNSKQVPRHIHETNLDVISLTKGQKATMPYFVIVAALFLLQSLFGGLIAHYRVESSFYGLTIVDWVAYNLGRTWHLQLAIFWIATAWVGGGLFIAPMLSGSEPRYQHIGINVLLGALVLVVLGSMTGEFLSAHGLLPGELWFWIGNQGSEYLDLGRFWQYLLIGGFFFWLWLLFRSLRPAFSNPKLKEFSILFFLAAAAIPIFYVPAVFYDHHTNFTVIDTWRFWIIHLWVEGFFEVFATVLTAAIFVHMGVTKLVTAKRVIYLDIILYLGSGVVGTGHHWYFTGQTNLNMALSACFSAMEVVPLTLLTLDAWDFIRVTKTKCAECGRFLASRQLWTIYYLIAVGVWNFVGAGIFGFLINLPIISYFEVGTNLTPNHGHAAMFGVFGMLSLAVTMFCMRNMQTEDAWDKTKRFVQIGFIGLNAGMALMVLIDLFPSGVLQLWDSMVNGYWHARHLNFIMSGLFHQLEWARLGADALFILVGVVPTVYAILITYISARRDSRNISFTAKS